MRSKDQGVYRLQKANLELEILTELLKESIADDIDKDSALLKIDEIKWLITNGLLDLVEGK